MMRNSINKIQLNITWIIIFVTASFLLLNAGITPILNLDLDNTYNDNILNLSEDDLDQYENQFDPDKYKIETSDDFITSVRLTAGFKHYIAGHTQIVRLLTRYNHYWKNDFMDDGYLGLSIRQYLSKKLNVGFYGFYFSDNYVNRYLSVLDDQYHDYDYDKNLYRGDVVYRFSKMFKTSYEFEFAQLRYNKYFTEYDADQMAHTINLYFYPYQLMQLKFAYTYKDTEADGEEAFENPDAIDVIKDGSYESNNYFGSVTLPEFLVINERIFKLDLSLNFNEKYFQSENPNDDYHLGRDDFTLTFKSTLSFDLTQNLGTELFYKYQKRTTESDFVYVEDDKGYKGREIGVSLLMKFFN